SVADRRTRPRAARSPLCLRTWGAVMVECVRSWVGVTVVVVAMAGCSASNTSEPVKQPGEPAEAGAPGEPECTSDSNFITGCVVECGESSPSVATAARCVDGKYQCPTGTKAAALCPADSWPSGAYQGCGPWIENYNCSSCAARCVDRSWTCPSC